MERFPDHIEFGLGRAPPGIQGTAIWSDGVGVVPVPDEGTLVLPVEVGIVEPVLVLPVDVVQVLVDPVLVDPVLVVAGRLHFPS